MTDHFQRATPTACDPSARSAGISPLSGSSHYGVADLIPKAAADFPAILIRTPYGRGKEVPLWAGYTLGELQAQRSAERGYHVIVQGAFGCSPRNWTTISLNWPVGL